MNDEHLKQRIAYLVEHGGIADTDPLEGVRKELRRVRILATAATVIVVADLTLAFV